MNELPGIIIIAASFACIIIFFIKKHKASKIDVICKKYPMQVAVFFDKSVVPSNKSLNEEEKKRLLDFPAENWEHWKLLTEKAYQISDKFSLVFLDYIEDVFPSVLRRDSSSNNHSRNASDRRHRMIDTMTMDELSLLVAESDESWTKRQTNMEMSQRIKNESPNGYKTYCEGRKISKAPHIEVIRDKRIIIQYEKFYRQSLIYTDWLTKQEEFCTKYVDLFKKICPDDGRFKYTPNFNKIDRFGKQISQTFKLWVGFGASFSNVHEERQPEYMIRLKNNLPEFETKSRHYINSVYDRIFNLLDGVSEIVEEFPLVVFVNSSPYNWSKDVYDYHYKRLKYLLNQQNYKYCDIESISSLNCESEYKSVIIVDFISSVKSAFNNTRLIAEYFTKKIPVIGYYTLIKEYNAEEMVKYHKVQTLSEEEEIEYIKTQLSKIIKHSTFHYTALPNALIGEAVGSENTKKIWLDNPDDYFFSVEVSNSSLISGEYSTDGGQTTSTIKFNGSSESLDDVAKFTYLLFKKMGVLKAFHQKGQEAINHMNQEGYLKNR